jgi:hypothetical protein
MNSVERNFTIVEKEASTMIYNVKKFRHYLLGNFFIFFVHHKILLYLVNKPKNIGSNCHVVLIITRI